MLSLNTIRAKPQHNNKRWYIRLLIAVIINNKRGTLKNPWAIALSFEKLKKLEEDAGVKKDSKWQRMFSSHPDLDKRIKTMSKRAEKDDFTRPENKMPERIVQEEPVTTKQTSNAQSSNKRTVGNRPAAKKNVGKKPIGKRPVGKRPATTRRR